LSEPSGGGPINGGVVRHHQRAAAQPSVTTAAAGVNSNKSRSENEGLDRYSNTFNEIEAGDVRDGQSILNRTTELQFSFLQRFVVVLVNY